MPTSHLHQLNEIVELIDLTQPATLLDVGVGFGKYGVLAREYLELRDGRMRYGDWQRRIDGVEVFPGYLTPLHDFVYDHIYTGDALAVLPDLPLTYDLILLVDVLEHFTEADGATLLEHCLARGRNVIVSTPRLFFRQQGFDNPYEQHLSHWTARDLAPYGPGFEVPNDISLIYYLGQDAGRVRRVVHSPRRWIKRWFPWLGVPYRVVKKVLNCD